MTQQQKKYIISQAIASFLINGVVNGLIGYFLNRHKQMALTPMSQNYVDLLFDIGITSLILAWLIAWTMNAGLKKANFYAVNEPHTRLLTWMGRRFKKPALYGWTLCIGMIPLLYGLTVLGIHLFSFTSITLWGYTIFKASYTAIAGTVFAIIFIISGFHVKTVETQVTSSQMNA